MNQNYEVHCGNCKWWGMIDQLKAVYRYDPIRQGGIIPTPGCPACLSDQYLEYEEDEGSYLTEFQVAWLEILALRRDVLRVELEQAIRSY